MLPPKVSKVVQRLFAFTVALVAAAGPAFSIADTKLPAELEGVGVKEKIGLPIDTSLEFLGEDGRVAPLKKYLSPDRPTILTLVYYECPSLCNLVLNGLTQSLEKVDWNVGKEFNLVTVSINPAETPQLAALKRQNYLAQYGRDVRGGWPFLVDYNKNVQKLAQQVGWMYKYDQKQKQYAHSAAIILLTPDGRVARYLYGIRFKPTDVKLGLTEAGEGKVGGWTERLTLMCFHYDPDSKSYVLFAQNVMRFGGGLVVLALGFVLYKLWRRERQAPPRHVNAIG
jgi:protein SCO1